MDVEDRLHAEPSAKYGAVGASEIRAEGNPGAPTPRAGLGRVIHLPRYNDPYQSCLLKALSERGLQTAYGNGCMLWNRIDLSLLAMLVRERGVRILHLHWQHPYLGGTGALARISKPIVFLAQIALIKLLGVRIVWTVHNLKDHESANERLEVFFSRVLARMADALIAHCDCAKQEIGRRFRIRRPGKVHVVPHGSFTAYFPNTVSRESARRSLGISGSRSVFLFLGLIRPYKGVLELVAAFKALKQDGACLIIAGKPVRPELAEEIRAACAGDPAIMLRLEFVPHESVQLYMNAADVVVTPYRDVLTSGSIFTAMSFGKPIVAPALGCIPEALGEGGGFIYHPDARDGLLDGLRAALGARADWARTGARNRALAEKLSWDRVAEETLALYATLRN